MDLRELVAHPDDAQQFQVYADQLQDQGDPRGELIALQLKREQQVTDATLREREAALLEQHGARWLGALAPHTKVPERRGRREPSAPLSVTWRRGFLDSVHLGPDAKAYETPEFDSAELVAKTFELESAALLRELVVCSLQSDDWPASWEGCVEAIASAEVPSTLHRLEFDRGGYWDISSTELGDLSPVYVKVPNLTSLRISLGSMELGRPSLPKLRSLEIVTGGLSGGNIESVLEGALPSLERLTLYLGATEGDHGCTVTFDDLRGVFEGRNLSRVKHLALANSNLADQIAEAIGRAKVLPQLTSLDLSQGTMTDAGGKALLANRAAFAHLETLDLRRNWLSDAMVSELKSLSKTVLLDGQEDADGDYRYVAISE
jgi:uncharacterized protein (TIGR02996 family)